MVFCDEKGESGVDLDRIVPPNTPSGGLRRGKSKRTDQDACLWEAIPLPYRAGHCFTDFWAAYQAVIRSASSTRLLEKKPAKQRVLERWNNTLRQRLARFVRKTLSFSKSLVMHETCLELFLHRYNRERATSLM